MTWRGGKKVEQRDALWGGEVTKAVEDNSIVRKEDKDKPGEIG